MKHLATTLVLSSLLFASPVIAGSGHGHSHAQTEVNQATAEKNADKIIASLVQRDKLDTSWSSIKAGAMEKKTFNGHPEWVIIYTNKKVANIDKQKLYVFLTMTGEYIAVNHSGN